MYPDDAPRDQSSGEILSMERSSRSPSNDGSAGDLTSVAMTQRGSFINFAALAARHTEGEMYSVSALNRGSDVGIFAPHGGFLEPCTDRIADAIAGDRFSLYLFCALVEAGAQDLHLTSARFDEPRGLALARACDTVVTVHGCIDQTMGVYIGGLDNDLRMFAQRELMLAGFEVLEATRPAILGVHPANLCNRGRRGMGLQLELAALLRDEMIVRPELITVFAETMRTAIDEWTAARRSTRG